MPYIQVPILIITSLQYVASFRASKRRGKDRTAIDALRRQAHELSPVSFHHPHPGIACSEAALRAFLYCAVAHQPFHSVDLYSVTGLFVWYKRCFFFAHFLFVTYYTIVYILKKESCYRFYFFIWNSRFGILFVVISINSVINMSVIIIVKIYNFDVLEPFFKHTIR